MSDTTLLQRKGHVVILCVKTGCSSAGGYRHCGGTCCFRLVLSDLVYDRQRIGRLNLTHSHDKLEDNRL
jgi:hypothetical protein